jgi:hypothetical protein
MEAIQITLEENVAQFGDVVVKQCDGTAMASIMHVHMLIVVT